MSVRKKSTFYPSAIVNSGKVPPPSGKWFCCLKISMILHSDIFAVRPQIGLYAVHLQKNDVPAQILALKVFLLFRNIFPSQKEVWHFLSYQNLYANMSIRNPWNRGVLENIIPQRAGKILLLFFRRFWCQFTILFQIIQHRYIYHLEQAGVLV